MENENMLSPGTLTELQPNKEYRFLKIGVPLNKDKIMDTASIFDFDKLVGFKVIDFYKGNRNKKYTTTNTFTETDTSYALGFGVKGKINLGMFGAEAKYMQSRAAGNLNSNVSERALMLYKFDNAEIKLDYGPANKD